MTDAQQENHAANRHGYDYRAVILDYLSDAPECPIAANWHAAEVIGSDDPYDLPDKGEALWQSALTIALMLSEGWLRATEERCNPDAHHCVDLQWCASRPLLLEVTPAGVAARRWARSVEDWERKR